MYLWHLDLDFAYLVIDDTSVQFEAKMVIAITGEGHGVVGDRFGIAEEEFCVVDKYAK